MKKFNTYKVILESGEDVYKIHVPAPSKREAEAYVAGNGDVVSVQDVTKDFPLSTSKLAADLLGAGWCQTQVDILTRLMDQVYANITD